MQKSLHLALVQENPTVGDVSGNCQKAMGHIRANHDVDLVVFSECFVSGYPILDLALRPSQIAAFEAGIDELHRQIIELDGPAVLIGSPASGAGLPYNAAFLLEPNGTRRVVRQARAAQ